MQRFGDDERHVARELGRVERADNAGVCAPSVTHATTKPGRFSPESRRDVRLVASTAIDGLHSKSLSAAPASAGARHQPTRNPRNKRTTKTSAHPHLCFKNQLMLSRLRREARRRADGVCACATETEKTHIKTLERGERARARARLPARTRERARARRRRPRHLGNGRAKSWWRGASYS